jgi:hypothetical protein
MDPVRTGLIFGLFLASFHAAWAVLVFMGGAQALLNFVFWAHFIAPPYRIEPFEAYRAAILIGFVFATGAAMGWVGALLWNGIGRSKAQ